VRENLSIAIGRVQERTENRTVQTKDVQYHSATLSLSLYYLSTCYAQYDFVTHPCNLSHCEQ